MKTQIKLVKDIVGDNTKVYDYVNKAHFMAKVADIYCAQAETELKKNGDWALSVKDNFNKCTLALKKLIKSHRITSEQDYYDNVEDLALFIHDIVELAVHVKRGDEVKVLSSLKMLIKK